MRASSSVDPRIWLAEAGRTAHRRKARRDFSRAQRRARRSRAGPSIGRRQRVEVARAFTVSEAPARLVILDEPTSSLDAHTAGQLLAYVRGAVAAGIACVLISHILGEVLETCDRIVVMRDGKVVATDQARNLDRTKLVAAMGGSRARRKPKRPQQLAKPTKPGCGSASGPAGRRISATSWRARARSSASPASPVMARRYSARRPSPPASRPRPGQTVEGPVAIIAGDRQSDGVFPERSIASNIGVRSLKGLRAGPFVSPRLDDGGLPSPGGERIRTARPMSTTTSCRSPAATSRRRCSPARSPPMGGWC